MCDFCEDPLRVVSYRILCELWLLGSYFCDGHEDPMYLFLWESYVCDVCGNSLCVIFLGVLPV